MGTKVHRESYLPGYYSMRDLNEGSSSSNWPLLYGDKTLGIGHYRNGFSPRTVTNAYPGGDKDVLKQKMLEHEAIFKNQVFELHRLYKIQKDMMDDSRRKELHKNRMPLEMSSSSSPLVSLLHSEDAWKLQKPHFPYVNCASGIEINSSPLSSTKGNGTQGSRFLSQNVCSSKDCEILESRPSKVRKKLFDLQLPADEYIDPEEEERSHTMKSDFSSYAPGRNHRLNSLDMNMGSGLKVDSNGDTFLSGSCLRDPIGLADLNEPIHVEEAIHPTSVNLLGHAEIKDRDLAAKSKSQFFLDLPKEVMQNPQPRSSNEISNSLHVDNIGNSREWLSYMHEEEYSSRTNLNSVPRFPQRDNSLMSSKPMDTIHLPSRVLPSDQVMGDLWREKTAHSLQFSERSRDYSSFYHLEPVRASHSVSTGERPSSSLTQKETSIQTHQPPLTYLGTSNTSSRSPSQSHEIFTDKWHFDGLYHGSSSGYRDPPTRFPLACFENLKSNKDDKVASERSINYSPNSYFKGSNFFDVKMTKEVNLNICPSKSSCIEIVEEEKKCEDRLKVLPWLRTETLKSSNQISTQKIAVASLNHDNKNERKIFGVPIFKKSSCTPGNESSSLISTSASLKLPSHGDDYKEKVKNGIIDINIACDPECDAENNELPVVEEKSDKNVSDFRTHIDLNSCLSEDEITLTPSVASTSATEKIKIDLEVPPVPESDDDILPVEQPEVEAVMIAAEAIITISSSGHFNCVEETINCCPSEPPLSDPLLWFVEVVSSFVDDFENFGTESRGKEGGNEGYNSNEMDDFVALTLNLKEMTEEEYMPKPLVPEIRRTDENGNIETGNVSKTNRPRRGQGRRGRQRRDFQRDILPGLASLSRHEVTEDIQTFGGLMRATGHVWNSSLTRRSGGGRGRRRLVVEPAPDVGPTAVCTSLMQELNNIGVGLEDRSLTIWGRTPRRPRRQRCPPPGNPPMIPLA